MTEGRSVEYGRQQIRFSLLRRPRATLEISVHPNGEVIVVAPEGATTHDIDSRVLKRARWVLMQQRYFSQFIPRTPQRRYVPGETHLYLGRQYRLAIIPDSPRRVVMTRGVLSVSGVEREDSGRIEQMVTDWYRQHAAIQFARRIDINRKRFLQPADFIPRSFTLKRMTHRWGSMSPNGCMLLNPDLVRAPANAIDYVITHELCHLAVSGHGPAFYELQSAVMPDWEQRKGILERMLA